MSVYKTIPTILVYIYKSSMSVYVTKLQMKFFVSIPGDSIMVQIKKKKKIRPAELSAAKLYRGY